jgi:hypothetical protein
MCPRILPKQKKQLFSAEWVAAAITDEVVFYFHFQNQKKTNISVSVEAKFHSHRHIRFLFHKHGNDANFGGGKKGTDIRVTMRQCFLLDRGFVN